MNRCEATWLAQIQARGDVAGNIVGNVHRNVADNVVCNVHGNVHGNVAEHSRVLVACSGGGDSVALLVFLWAIRKNLNLELLVAHADHGLRPEAQEDARFVESLCRSLDLDLVETRLNVKAHAKASKQGLETAARELRWAWLQAEAESTGARTVATGHTLDDHTETVLMRLARGGGLGSLTPLPARQGLRWSPLVQARRTELRTYLQRKNIPWREDSSNQDPFTARNRWRGMLEPFREEAPAFDAHLWETHQQVDELRTWIDAQIASWRGIRWDTVEGDDPSVSLTGTWTSPELRWAMEAAFRKLDWPRESVLLRGLETWILERLRYRNKRMHTWGAWHLEPIQAGWILKPGP